MGKWLTFPMPLQETLDVNFQKGARIGNVKVVQNLKVMLYSQELQLIAEPSSIIPKGMASISISNK